MISKTMGLKFLMGRNMEMKYSFDHHDPTILVRDTWNKPQ